MSNIYPASYLRFKANKYVPPTDEAVIDSCLQSIMLSLDASAASGKYRSNIPTHDKRIMFQTKPIAIGVLNKLVELGYHIDVKINDVRSSYDPYPDIIVGFEIEMPMSSDVLRIESIPFEW